jgi:hypothetical protein
MKKLKAISIFLIFMTLATSCADQLDVKNPNSPVANSINTEANIVAVGLGVYVSGFRNLKYGGFQGQYANDVLSYHEIMGDVIGVEAANVYINQLGMPDWVKLDNGTTVPNPATPNTQLGLLRVVNLNASAAANPVYYEWAYMYNLNAACNAILKSVDGITYAGDQDTKKNTLKAWAYWWKGFAYSHIGSMYYAGVINNDVGVTNNNYVDHNAIIAESNANYDLAIAALNAVTVTADYTNTLKAMIPAFMQVGKGQVPTVPMFIRNIHTMKARNVLVNTRVAAMTQAQWTSVLSEANLGIQSGDNVFRALSNATGDFMSASGGTVAAVASGDPSAVTFKISERLIQEYKPGDKRLTNNFSNAVSGGKWLGNSDRGNIFNTRWKLLNNATGVGPAGAGVQVIANASADGQELWLAGTFEENELMKAEAKIYIGAGDLPGAIASIDIVRNAQGAGLGVTPVVDILTTKEELRRERRVALAFRALSYYDARRWGVIDPVSSGGGRNGAVVVDKTGLVNTNAQINYNYLDYWDVPDNEIVFNVPSAASAPTKNPRTN